MRKLYLIIGVAFFMATINGIAAGIENTTLVPETGVTFTQKVPFSIESMSEVVARESILSIHIQKRRAIPFHKGPSPKELMIGTMSQIPNITTLSRIPIPIISRSFIGLSDDDTAFPPDTQGAVGPLYLMEMNNEKVGLFKKSTGLLISNVSLQAFWKSLGTGPGEPANFTFDPKIIYDQNSGRFITVTDGGGSSPGSWILLAVSNSSDPTGIWFKWAIRADQGQESNNWADYPCLGVDDNYVYITANMLNNSGDYMNGTIYVIPKTQLLEGFSSITYTLFILGGGWSSGFTMQPAYTFGPSPGEYIINEKPYGSREPFPCPGECLDIVDITFPGGKAPMLNLTGLVWVNWYPGTDQDSLPDAPQNGSNKLINTGDSRLMNAVFRNGHLWATHTVSDNNKTEIAWYEIDPNTIIQIGTPIQEGRITGNRWYYYPSIAVNSYDDVGIGFSGSSPTEYVGAYYTARNIYDRPGTMQSVTLLKAGLAPYYKIDEYGRNRWGDYSATGVDPIDNTFWTIQEYANKPIEDDLWGTWWGKFNSINIR